MTNERVILCGGAMPADPSPPGHRAPIELMLWGDRRPGRNATLKLSDITERMAANLPARFIDLLDIAAYVYCADQAASRGGKGLCNYGASWRRNLRFHVPVRDEDFWRAQDVRDSLEATLGFLSDDNYEFTFSRLRDPPPLDGYFEFGKSDRRSRSVDEVLLFSGGLDSLGGAVLEAVSQEHAVALVSHRSNPKIAGRQRDLVTDLSRKCRRKPLHVPVWVNKDSALSRDDTQRTRSFLYAALGAVVAQIFGLRRIRFYENGIVSINLPIAPQVIGARATRTTHPRVLRGFAELFTKVFDVQFQVDNPFLWMTKAEVVRTIAEAGCRDLIRHSVSCTRVRDMTTLFSHCGSCSQCISRRFSTLAAGCADDDPSEMYKVDLLRGERKEGAERTLVECVARLAKEMQNLSDAAFFARFPESLQVLSATRNLQTTEVAERLYNLHRRHADEVFGVITQGVRDHAKELIAGLLPGSCLLVLSVPDSYRSGPATSASDAEDTTKGRPDELFCRAIGSGGTEWRTRHEYETLKAQADDFDMFIDGVTLLAKRRGVDGLTSEAKVTPREFAILCEYIESKRVLRPYATRAGQQCNSSIAATKCFEKARGKVDVKIERFRFRAFRTHKSTDPSEKAYDFAPPDGFRYCLVIPSVQVATTAS